jgi:ABC-type glycerol-3-phosphate transport system permease component
MNQRSSRLNARTRRRISNLPVHAVLMLLLLLSLLPVAMLFIQSGKTAEQFDANPWGLALPYNFGNFAQIAPGVTGYLMNTLTVCIAAISIALTIASFSAYVFARFAFPGKELLYYAVISLMMVPFVLSLVPQYILIRRLGLLDTLWALIFPYAAGGAVFGVFLLRPFIASLPEDLFEAARMDGANELQTFFRIALPLCAPIIVTLSILLLLGQWNDVIWPSVAVLDEQYYTVSIGIWSLTRGYTQQTEWGLVFAAFTITSLPILILFIVARRFFIQGLSSGAIKL